MSDTTTQTTLGSAEETFPSLKASKPKPFRGWAPSKNGPLHWNQTGCIMAGEIRNVEQKKQRKMWTTVDRSTLSVNLLKANLAEDGCEEAQLDIAKKLLEDSDETHNEAYQRENSKKAIYWLIKSAEQGNEEATNLLKQCLKTGQGITHQNISDVRSCVGTPKNEKLVFKAARKLYDKLSNGEEFITTTQIIDFWDKDSKEEGDENVHEDDTLNIEDPDTPNRTFVIHEEEPGLEAPKFALPSWLAESNAKPSGLSRDREGVKLTKADLLSIAKSYNDGDVPDVAISGQVWGTRHYQSFFYFLTTFILQFLLLSMMLKALTMYSGLLVVTSWVVIWSTYGFLVWHKGLSIFSEWTRAFQSVLRNNPAKDFSNEPKLVSKNLLPMYAISLAGLGVLQLLSAPPVLVILLGILSCFGIIRGVGNYKIKWQTVFVVTSTLVTSPTVLNGIIRQLSAIPYVDLVSANDIYSVGTLALQKTIEEYVGLIPPISLHIAVAVVNSALVVETYLHSRRITDVLEQLVVYLWFLKSVYLIPSTTTSGLSSILGIAFIFGTLFYLLDTNKNIWTVLAGTALSALVVILVVLTINVISSFPDKEAPIAGNILSWKEYNEKCHRKAWESSSVVETRIECSRKYERTPTYVSWTGKISSVRVVDVQPLFSVGIQDEISFEILVNVGSNMWETDDGGSSWQTLLTGTKDKEMLSIVSLLISTKDVVGAEAKNLAVERLLSLRTDDFVKINGVLVNGAGGLKPEIGHVKLFRCYYCEDDLDTEEIFAPTESLSRHLLGGFEEYLGPELLSLVGEAEASIRSHLQSLLMLH